VILFQRSADLRNYLAQFKGKNMQIGFVPTMGALHAGHLSLLKMAKEKCDIVVCSIFVNPTQFNLVSDLETYPRPIDNDIRLLVHNQCDILFNPNVDEIYGGNFLKDSSDDYGLFISVLEGAKRPGHFDGVITVVKKLFNLVQPNEVFFGQKDYQQCLVIKTLINRDFPTINFNLCPISREFDGLAMSSRNVRLNPMERVQANRLYTALKLVYDNWLPEKWESAVKDAGEMLSLSPFKLEYFEICELETLVKMENYKDRAIVLVALQIGNTRLIDNMILDRDNAN
jgi:pantoate--beta-alanine ligase